MLSNSLAGWFSDNTAMLSCYKVMLLYRYVILFEVVCNLLSLHA